MGCGASEPVTPSHPPAAADPSTAEASSAPSATHPPPAAVAGSSTAEASSAPSATEQPKCDQASSEVSKEPDAKKNSENSQETAEKSEVSKETTKETAEKSEVSKETAKVEEQEEKEAGQNEKVDEDDQSESGSEGEEPVERVCTRRGGVSAEALARGNDDWQPPVHEKSPEERKQLLEIFQNSQDGKLHMLVGSVKPQTFEKILDAMFAKVVAANETVMSQGDVGDYFYIVKNGSFDIFVQKGSEEPVKVFTASPGFAFGELALLYNAPRSATITAACDSEVWCLDRTAFRNLVVRSAEQQFQQYVSFLARVEVFQPLSEDEKGALAEVLLEESFANDEAIIEQGDHDDKFFMILSGQAVACIQGEQGEVEVTQYKEGDYFGEIALLTGEARKASVYAVGATECLYITRQAFQRILGPLQHILQRNIERYANYVDAISAATDDVDAADVDNEAGPKVAKVRSRRKRASILAEAAIDHTVLEAAEAVRETEQEESGSGETLTLAEKVEMDFKRPELVTPCETLAVPSSSQMIFGGVVPHQKFTMNKFIHVRSAPSFQEWGEDRCFTWQGQTKVKSLTDISVVCQKGQKSSFDPTPNQDNFFVNVVGAVTMYGVFDGHGPFGHLVSLRLVQSMPYHISKSEHYGKDWEATLKEAFLESQRELEEFCIKEEINIEASGAAGSVLLLEEQTVHIAFIGDARVVLGSWNRRDSRMIFTSKDHKPDLPEEKARLEAAGSEVREIDPGNCRIYRPGENFPGLTMSRAFGDTACNGILREPEYHKFLMQPADQWYAIVASDGVWEFFEGEEVSNLSAKKLRLKGPRETNQFLVSASRKRWERICGDYCDDITSILVQWNSADAPRDVDCNHQLTVSVKEGMA